MKTCSVFFPDELLARARNNMARYEWAARTRDSVENAAQPWLAMDDDQLWGLMFGPGIPRSWMVWSSGYCPACREGVPMYEWRIDALREPWKVRCPHCGQAFPTNDFEAFYRSGLNERAVFDPDRADRALLYNAEHPDPQDPLHDFGVDAGQGYRDGEHTWWFVGTYLIYGQWKQAVLAGIVNLAAAYALSGDRACAHKAAVLLDRVADLYPSFDFKEQGVMYEGPADAGYVSTWHDACEETREMALAYDQIRGALSDDDELVRFLADKARACGLDNPKATGEDIRRNIETGLLLHPIEHPERIHSNYPRREIALIVLRTVLDQEGYRAQIEEMIDDMLEQATAVDGVTGEKGLAGYSSFVIQGLAQFIEQYTRIDSGFLADLFRRHPRLRETYRFHIDTWCLQQYYPQAGDTGAFARKFERYAGAIFTDAPGLQPSMFTLFRRLYQITGDAAYVQVLYHANGGRTTDLPHDLFAEDPEAFQTDVQRVIDQHGTQILLSSVDKAQWHLAVLRSGAGRDRRAAWIDYDSGGGHGHLDGMNIGLFARGLDLMPDFGYPPVQYGGWTGPRFHWYRSTAGHNTVVIDGKDQAASAAGRHTLWGAGRRFRAIRVCGAELYGVDRYERTLLMVDLPGRDFYLVDIFRVVGGTDHAKFMHSHFGTVETSGLDLEEAEDYGFGTQMRGFRTDRKPQPGWWVEWNVEDRYGYLAPGEQVFLKYWDFTTGAEASLAEAWISLGGFDEAWIPRLMVRRRAEAAPLRSTFVSVIAPHGGSPGIRSVRRLGLITGSGDPCPDSCVALEIEHADGGADLVLAADVGHPSAQPPQPASGDMLVQNDREVSLQGELGVIRRDASGAITALAVWNGRSVHAGDTGMDLERRVEFAELEAAPGGAAD